MSTHADQQEEAAVVAAKARRVIADRIAKLAPGVENDDLALVVLHLPRPMVTSLPNPLGREEPRPAHGRVTPVTLRRTYIRLLLTLCLVSS